MNRLIPFLLGWALIYVTPLFSQIEFTANDSIPSYEGHFRYGANMGAYYYWRDEQLADIAAGNPALGVEGVGVDALRPLLSEWFLDYWGYDIRLEAFQHYGKLGIKDNVVFIGYPSEAHRDQTNYCESGPSELFANMYLPIWDDGENGTPVNDSNFYAVYLWNMVTAYDDHVKYWEIWNEPDFDFVGYSSLQPGETGNWWEYDPDPCHYALRAPVEHYVRLLRISYEVIKYISPDDYIALGGIGYPSFLDVLLRNTDNPIDGSVDSLYPLTGGAYFDVVSYHSYPHIDNSLRYWSNEAGGFVYTRHSDQCVNGMLQIQTQMRGVLEKYGYDGIIYPKKRWLITESNIPRVQVGEFIGSSQAQRNYIVKALITCQQNDIDQFHIYQIGDISVPGSFSEFHAMGLFAPLDSVPQYEQKVHDVGIAYKTTSSLLKNKKYNAEQTANLKLPEGVRGAAFRDEANNFTYVLWAVTNLDRSEEASATYQFPASFNLQYLYRREWNYSVLGVTKLIAGNAVALTGSPAFFTDGRLEPVVETTAQIEMVAGPNPFNEALFVRLNLPNPEVSSLSLLNIDGQIISVLFTNEYLAKGEHKISLNIGHLPPGMYLLYFKTRLGDRVARRVIRK